MSFERRVEQQRISKAEEEKAEQLLHEKWDEDIRKREFEKQQYIIELNTILKADSRYKETLSIVTDSELFEAGKSLWNLWNPTTIKKGFLGDKIVKVPYNPKISTDKSFFSSGLFSHKSIPSITPEEYIDNAFEQGHIEEVSFANGTDQSYFAVYSKHENGDLIIKADFGTKIHSSPERTYVAEAKTYSSLDTILNIVANIIVDKDLTACRRRYSRSGFDNW